MGRNGASTYPSQLHNLKIPHVAGWSWSFITSQVVKLALMSPLFDQGLSYSYSYVPRLEGVPTEFQALVSAFRPWESSEPACELFLLATQMYFFYLVVNRVDVCTLNSS